MGAIANIWYAVATCRRITLRLSQDRKTAAKFMLGAEYMRMLLEDLPMAIA